MTSGAVVEAPEFRKRRVDGGWDYVFNWPQTLLLKSEARYPVMQSGVRAGKTTGLVVWLAQERDKRGPGHYIWVDPTYPLLEKAMPELHVQFGEIDGYEYQAARRRFVSTTLNEEGQPEYVVWLGSADKPESLAATTLKGAAFDEAGQSGVKSEAFLQLRRGLVLDKGRMAFGTTLYAFANAYRYEVYDRWKAGHSYYELIQADSLENPAFSEEEYYAKMDEMPWWKFNMTYRGIYERPLGSVYDCFDPETHVVDPFPIPPEWPWVWGHDFGPTNTAALAGAVDPATGQIFIFWEYHEGRRSILQHAEHYRRVARGSSPWGPVEGGAHIRFAYGGSHQEDEIRQAYSNAGWKIREPNIHSVDAGIAHAYSFIAKNQVSVFKTCPGIIDQLLTYSYDLQDDYEPTDRILNKSAFHLVDCLRYMTSGFDRERVQDHKSIKMQVFRGSRHNRRKFQPIGRRGKE